MAVDISQWACNALTQQATAELWTEEGRVAKVAFDRVPLPPPGMQLDLYPLANHWFPAFMQPVCLVSEGLFAEKMLCAHGRSTSEREVLDLQVINLLRFGCIPVGVLDGQAPEAKLATLQARYAPGLAVETRHQSLSKEGWPRMAYAARITVEDPTCSLDARRWNVWATTERALLAIQVLCEVQQGGRRPGQ